MDRGITVENPYASVNLPRAQLKGSFLRYYLGDDQSPDTVLFNPSALPTYSETQEKEREATQPVAYGASWDGQKVQTQETWAPPFNPYASLKMPGGGSPEQSYHWKSSTGQAAEKEDGCCCCCCGRKCCPYCKRCCCVVS